MYRTILGAIIGLSIGLLLKNGWAIGALVIVGALIGSRFDLPDQPKSLDEDPSPKELSVEEQQRLRQAVEQTQARQRFVDDVSALFVALAQADGELVREEVRVARRFFEDDLGFSAVELEGVRAAIKRALSSPLSIEEAADRCRTTMTETERVLLINALFEVALADGPLTSDEERLLTRAAEDLRLPPADLRTVFEMHLGKGEQHYKALGVASDVSDDELRRAYKRLVVLHHPDRVAHLGAAAQDKATARFREIQNAWEHVRRTRGL